MAKGKFLCVEDDPDTAVLTRERLARQGYEVEIAGDGDQALSMLESGGFDAVMIDYRIPGMSGLQLLEKLRKTESALPAVMVTGHGDESVAAVAMKLGAGEYVVKDSSGHYLDRLPTLIEFLIERHRADAERERQRLAREEEASDSIARLDALIRMVHDMRTGLTSILGFAEIIGSKFLGPVGDPRYAEYAWTIHEDGLALLGLVNGILELSRLEAGRIQIIEERVDVTEVVAACARRLGPWTGTDRLALSVEAAPDLPALLADRRGLERIVDNLLSNAVKFTPKGGKITVSAAIVGDAEEERMVLGIADNGVGIAADDLAGAMEPFSRVKTTPTNGKAGSGLGLSIVRQLVELHGGTFRLESTVGAGTTATVSFPRGRLLR